MSRGGGRPLVAVLDNEALQAIADVAHAKHRAVMALVQAMSGRNNRSPGSARLLTTTAVRVEALIDRSAPAAARLGAMRVHDVPLDGARADGCVALSSAAGGSAVDATVAQAAADAALLGAKVSIYTSDLKDLQRLAAVAGNEIAVRRV